MSINTHHIDKVTNTQTKVRFYWVLITRNNFFGAFAKSRKAAITLLYLSVRPQGITRNPLDGFSWNLIFEYFFENMLRKFKFHLNPTRIYIYDYGDFISCSVLLTMKYVSDKSCREKQSRHFMVNNVFRKSFHLWDTVEKVVYLRLQTHTQYM